MTAPDTTRYARRHLVAGWSALAMFLTLGIVLESLHGFKAGWYLGPRHETRRLLWTLAHAHGTLLAVIQIVFALYLRVFPPARTRGIRLASACLLAGSLLVPFGFFLGGAVEYGGDPGPAVLLVPIAAPALLLAVVWAARSARGE
jgi:hypothetical protein